MTKQLLYFSAVYLIIFSCSVLGCTKQHVHSLNGEVLKNENRQLLLDADNTPYLFFAFDNRSRHPSGSDNPRFDLTKDEMQVYCENLMLDLRDKNVKSSEFEYVVIHFFDFETKAELGRFKYLL